MERNIEEYSDIIEFEYRKNKNRPNMSKSDRSAQFAPFAALTGHKEKIVESGRFVESEIEVSDTTLDKLNLKYALLMKGNTVEPEIEVCYFKKDSTKYGGEYLDKIGIFRKIDEYEKVLIFKDGVKIHLKDIVEISGEIFKGIE